MYNNLKRNFYEDSRRLSEWSLKIHMSRVNFDQQYLGTWYGICIAMVLSHVYNTLVQIARCTARCNMQIKY